MDDNRKTPVFDWETGEFLLNSGNVVTTTGKEAVKQIILKAQQTARGVFLIYANTDQPELNHKYGSDVFETLTHSGIDRDTLLSELKRAVAEAIKYDPWIKSVYDVDVNIISSSEVEISFTVTTIYDDTITVEGVGLNG